jgi:hypothetical protein
MMTFTETRKGIWESDKQAYTAAMINRDGKLLGDKEAAYKIEEGEKKGATVYRVYEAHLGGYHFIKTLKTLEAAIKYVNSIN